MKKAFMFGFRKESIDETGFLRVRPEGGYEVVSDRDCATGFNPDDAEKWREFFSKEEELAEWKFHPVFYITEEIRND